MGAIVGAAAGIVTAGLFLHAVYDHRHPGISTFAAVLMMGLIIGSAMGALVGWDDRS
jgi:hypothetical protein